MNDTTRWSPRFASACAALFVISLAVSFIGMERSVLLYDEGLILVGAQRVSAGAIPHRDFYANYGPANFYVLSWLFQLFSPSILVERVWDSAVRSSIVVLVVVLVHALGRGVLPWVAGLFTLLWLTAYGFYGYPVFPVIALCLASALMLLPAFAGDLWPGRIVGAGVLMGSAGLFRYDAAAGGCLCTVAVLIAMASRLPARDRIWAMGRLLGSFFVGVTAIVAPVGLAYWWTGTLRDLMLQVVQIPARSYVATRAMPAPSLSDVLAAPLEIGGYLPFLVAAVGALVLGIDSRHKRTTEPRFWLVLLLWLLMLTFMAKGSVRFSAIQMSMATIMSVALLGCSVQRPFHPGLLRRAALVGVSVAMVLGAGPAGSVDIKRAVANVRWLRDGADCVPSGCFSVDADTLEAVSYVKRVTAPGTPLFVGLGRHDKILENDVLFYFLADRPPATKWYHMDPSVQTSEPIQREMVAELRAAAPPFVVLDTEWDDSHEPNDSAISSGVTLLDDYIRGTFSRVEVFGGVQIWARGHPG